MSEFNSFFLENQKDIGNGLCIFIVAAMTALAAVFVTVERRMK